MLPIDIEIVKRNAEIPKLIAKLSYYDKELAIKYIRHFGEMTMPITPLHEKVIGSLSFWREEADHAERTQKLS